MNTVPSPSKQAQSPSYFFPVLPKSERSFVSFLFWHSIALTCTTPLSRFFKNSWDGKLIIPTILNYLGIPQFFLGREAIDTYLAYAPSPKTDRAFGPHAFFGLMWLVAAYLHICHRQHFQSKTSKRVLGMFAMLAFLGHQICSFRCLLINPVNQHVLPWTMLLTNLTVSTGYFILGMYALAKKDMDAHKDALMRCFLYSIEGAGTIRTVGAIMHAFGVGPTFCQQGFGGCAAQCVFSYVHRLIWIRLLTVYYNGIYAKSRGCAETWNMYKSGVKSVLALCLFITAVFFVANDPEQLFNSIFLASNGSRSFATALAFSVCVQTILYPDTPVLIKLVNGVNNTTKKNEVIPAMTVLKATSSMVLERRLSSTRLSRRGSSMRRQSSVARIMMS